MVEGRVGMSSISLYKQIQMRRKLMFVISSFILQQLYVFYGPAFLANSNTKSLVKTTRKCI